MIKTQVRSKLVSIGRVTEGFSKTAVRLMVINTQVISKLVSISGSFNYCVRSQSDNS